MSKNLSHRKNMYLLDSKLISFHSDVFFNFSSRKLYNFITLMHIAYYHYLQDGTFTLAYIDLHWATSEHNVAGQNPADLGPIFL